ncbi:MAG: iron-sulfur cluster assembly scaffold protein [Candidatus Moranbacteria bacterium]|nr:iron-sulfur cluster assembly scaffold protein [Candidatus Moranbacteria bacterium]
MYSQVILDHFRYPSNQGSIENADAVGQKGNPACGDIMKLYLKIGERKNEQGEAEKYIEDIKFETLGCAAAIAISSLLTERIKDSSIEQAKKITKEDILEKTGELPESKIHCSMLAIDALHSALKKYNY